MTTVEASEIDSAPVDEAYSYAELVNDGITARKAMDTGRWLIGEYTRSLVTYYKQKTIEEYARDISVPAKRVYEYGVMASFYPLEIRESLAELDLTYSHFREARRLKDLDKAIDFLKAAALNLLSVDDMRQSLKAMKRLEGMDLADKYSDGNTVTDHYDKPIDQRPIYQWRGPALVEVDKQGVVHIRCDHTPEIEPNKRYIVSFEEIEE
jgi:hypothetical protein